MPWGWLSMICHIIIPICHVRDLYANMQSVYPWHLIPRVRSRIPPQNHRHQCLAKVWTLRPWPLLRGGYAVRHHKDGGLN